MNHVARDLTEQLPETFLDVLRAGWTKYVELDEGQVRVSWHQEGPQQWCEVWSQSKAPTLLGRFTVDITVTPYVIPPIGPEDDGALRAELSEEPDPCPEHSKWGSQLSCSACCALRRKHYEDLAKWDPDYPGCAPEECGGSRLDPCSTVMKTEGRAHDCEVTDHPFVGGVGSLKDFCTEPMVSSNGYGGPCGLPASAHIPEHSLHWQVNRAKPEPWQGVGVWADTRAGDQVQGDDGGWYPVKASNPSLNPDIHVVILEIGNREHVYDMPGRGQVHIRRGPESQAVQNIKDAFPGSEEIR